MVPPVDLQRTAMQAAPSCSPRCLPQQPPGRFAAAQAPPRRHARSRRRVPPPPAAVLAPSQPDVQLAVPQRSLTAVRLLTAIKTPYVQNGRFDLPAFDRLVEHQLANGVEGFIIGGTTGEGQLMSWDEHIMLIAHTVNQFGDRAYVIGNTGSNSTREALHATEQGFNVGMHAALHINPYYGKTSTAGLLNHFKAVLAEGPAIIYNVPGRTGQDIPNSVVHELAGQENFLGIKECTGNQRIQAYAERGIRCWSGNDDEAHTGRHDHGAQGVISVTSNLIPGLFSRLMQHRDEELNKSLAPLVAWLFCEPNPIPVNTALAMCGLIRPVFRLPYVPLSRPQREEGARLLRAVQAHLPGVQDVQVLEDDDFTLLSRF